MIFASTLMIYGTLYYPIFLRTETIVCFFIVCRWVYLRLDEGKSILWDRTEDTFMKARAAHNLILYNGLEGIRMKGNPNVTVTNNAVITVKGRVRLIPDGITADNDDPIPNLVLKDNLVHSYFYDYTNKGHAFVTWDNFDDEVLSRVLQGLGDDLKCHVPNHT